MGKFPVSELQKTSSQGYENMYVFLGGNVVTVTQFVVIRPSVQPFVVVSTFVVDVVVVIALRFNIHIIHRDTDPTTIPPSSAAATTTPHHVN